MVLLHVIETAGPVDLRGDLAGFDRRVQHVQDVAGAFLRVDDFHTADRSAIARLSSAFRIERGAVENSGRTSVQIADLEHAGAKRLQIRILQVEAFGHEKRAS